MKSAIAILAAILCFGLVAPKSKAQEPNISGKWHFVFQTEDGERVFDPVFQQDGDKVSGKWGNSDVHGTFADGKLNLEFEFNSDEVGPGTLKVNGELADGALAGDWQFQTYSGKFKATRSESGATRGK